MWTKVQLCASLITLVPSGKCFSSSILTCNTRRRINTWFTMNNNKHDIPDSYLSRAEEHESKRILDGLNPSQTEAVTQPIQSLTRVIAGPGAGKTRVLTCRIAYLLKRDDRRILAVTFTKKAATEMKDRLNTLLLANEENQLQKYDEGGEIMQANPQNSEEIYQEDSGGHPSSSIIDRVTCGTFHSVCAKILRWHGSELSSLPSISKFYETAGDNWIDNSFTIIDQGEQLRIIKKCVADCGIDLKHQKKEIRPISVLSAVSRIKSDDSLGNNRRTSRDKNDEKKTSGLKKIAEQVYAVYQTTILKQNAFDFDDLILKTRELLMISPEIQKRIRGRWRHILVDEFQDTSEAQLDIVKLLTSESLLVVGDGDQSIYSWRGAYSENISEFVKEFSALGKAVKTVYIMENYRSTSNIVSAAQKVISSESSSLSSTQGCIREDMKPIRGAGPSPRVISCSDSEDEASIVTREIKKMEMTGVLTPSSTIAFIYRTNAQSRAFEEACVKQNIRYLVRGNAGTFYSRIEIKDCICFLTWLYNGWDKNAITRSMQTPPRGIGEVSLREFFEYCEEAAMHFTESNPDSTKPSPLDILISLSQNEGERNNLNPPTLSKRTLNRLLPFSSQMKLLQQKAKVESVSDLLSSIIDVFSLRNHFDSISKTKDEFADRWNNVLELCNASKRYSKDGPSLPPKNDVINKETSIEDNSPLGNFLDDVSLLTEINTSHNDSKNESKRLLVNLMTIHSSKGMEFDTVVLVGNEEGTFPTQRAINEGESSIQLDEERRLCYVAITRAKTHLIMTWRRSIFLRTAIRSTYINTQRSRFLDALIRKKKVPVNRISRSKREAVSRVRHKIRVGNVDSEQSKRSLSRKSNIHDTSKSDFRKQRQVISGQDRVATYKNDPPPAFDSTMFYPVGSFISHAVHGNGKVIPPPPSSGDSMKVYVKFENEWELSFHLDDSSLLRVFKK